MLEFWDLIQKPHQMQKTNEEDTEYILLESQFELCEAREEAEIEQILSRIFLTELTQQLICRNYNNY